MTEFDRWRLARQETEQLLQALAPVPRPSPPPQWLPGLPWQRPAQAARAALRRLRSVAR